MHQPMGKSSAFSHICNSRTIQSESLEYYSHLKDEETEAQAERFVTWQGEGRWKERKAMVHARPTGHHKHYFSNLCNNPMSRSDDYPHFADEDTEARAVECGA